MKTTLKMTAAALVTGSALLVALPAQAFWGPFDWFDDDDYYYGPYGPYGYGGPWGHPGYGYGGYPGYGYGGYPGYGYGGYPGYGYGGYPGYGYPYAAPAAPAATAPATTE
ncbi:MAG: hypothetical protein KZQ73_14280 [Candidatus Thiodiazotropha sp. (ex Semelilucina semeliformis)]|nr:hypothetical protein [Candidatus Thiodiazotropha sp. (ex Semelilucina semeliformis)]